MKIGIDEYKTNVLYPRIVIAVFECLERTEFVAPVDVFIKLGYLNKDDLIRWKLGKIEYLEKVIKCNLSKAGSVLQILRFHGHDLKLFPSISVYKHKSKLLRFSKTGDSNLENAYSTHLLKIDLINKAKAKIKNERLPI
jgi:hypothetical protein